MEWILIAQIQVRERRRWKIKALVGLWGVKVLRRRIKKIKKNKWTEIKNNLITRIIDKT